MVWLFSKPNIIVKIDSGVHVVHLVGLYVCGNGWKLCWQLHVSHVEFKHSTYENNPTTITFELRNM